MHCCYDVYNTGSTAWLDPHPAAALLLLLLLLLLRCIRCNGSAPLQELGNGTRTVWVRRLKQQCPPAR
jgi:hypothetical protein